MNLNKCYEILNVRPDTSEKQIRKAYIKLVKLYHPDLFRSNLQKMLATKKFLVIDEAFKTIKQAREEGPKKSRIAETYTEEVMEVVKAILEYAASFKNKLVIFIRVIIIIIFIEFIMLLFSGVKVYMVILFFLPFLITPAVVWIMMGRK